MLMFCSERKESIFKQCSQDCVQALLNKLYQVSFVLVYNSDSEPFFVLSLKLIFLGFLMQYLMLILAL